MPNRIIREGFLDSEAINGLSDASECFYHRLMLAADDAGRTDGRSEMIKSKIYPLKEKVKSNHIDSFIKECLNQGLLMRYECLGKAFIQIMKWQRCSPCSVSRFPWVDASHKIEYLKLDTRDGLKDFVKTSIPDPMLMGSLSHTTPFKGLPCQCTETETYTETETKTKTIYSQGEVDLGKEAFSKQAKEVIDYLNEKAGTGFQHSDSSLKPILARLKDGATVEQCKLVVDCKSKQWLNNIEYSQYLRPSTLFNGEKFSNYLGVALKSQPKQDFSSWEVIKP
jgi:uncharacterized phage protein (TIGR02220 family)